MPVIRITTRAVNAFHGLPPAGRRQYLWDISLKGFGVMVTPAGRKSYIIQYRIGGRQSQTRRVFIGHHLAPWTADEAREQAAQLLSMVRVKIDPFDARRVERLAQEKQQTERHVEDEERQKNLFAALAEVFIKKYAIPNQQRSWKETDSIFRRDLIPHFAGKTVDEIGRRDIQRLLDTVGNRNPSAANKAHKALKTFFGWLVDRGEIPISPMEAMGRPHAETERSRTLSDAELAQVWLLSDKLPWQFQAIIRLLMLTGQRLREVAEIKREELDFERALWTLPDARTKNGHEHLVPLSDEVMRIFRQSIARSTSGIYLFTTTGKSPVSGFSKIKKRLDDLMARPVVISEDSGQLEGFKDWQFHDLRRTLATGCQKLGVKIEVTEAILNHVSGTRKGIVKVYQTYNYLDEKAEALRLWETQLLRIIK